MKQPKQAVQPQPHRPPLPPGKPASKGGQKPRAKPPPKHHVSAAVHHARHVAAVKAAHTRTKNAKVKKARPKKQPRGLALGQAVACCPAEALAASLRLTGQPVSDRDVLALYRHTASGPDAGAPILGTLEAAAEFGLAGVRLTGFAPVDLDDPAGVILGLDLPGPHAVCDDGTCWWSWGQQWQPGDFPDAVIGEAWAVTW